MKKEKKMDRTYNSPQMEVLETVISDCVIAGSVNGQNENYTDGGDYSGLFE